MFVRAKTIKGQKYGYLVKNNWKKGKVKQETKKYLGRIIPVLKPNNSFIPFKLDFSSSLKECMINLIKNEFCSRGFIKHSRQNAIVFEDTIINFSTNKIIKHKKNVVLFINNRYFYSDLLKELILFYNPESSEDVKGQKLAQAFSDTGISIQKEDFVNLYKKAYY
jgi:hypothetical protein